MKDKIVDTSSDLFDAETGNYIGMAQFDLTSEAENDLLNFINYNIVPKSIILLNVNMKSPAASYVAPIPFALNKRIAVLRGAARDKDSALYTPFEIRLKYDTVARGYSKNNAYHADSVELSNIQPIAINWIQF